LDLLAFEGEPLVFEGDAFGGEIAAAEARELGSELAKASHLVRESSSRLTMAWAETAK